MQIKSFFDPRTWTLTYVVWDDATRQAMIIDPVLDYDPRAVSITTEAADAVIAFVRSQELSVAWILETHAHADHLSASQHLKEHLGGVVAIGQHITAVQEVFHAAFNLSATVPVDGSQFDRLLGDGDILTMGGLSITVIATPGHTPACVSYHIGDALFTGDALFMPDSGTGRCDFPRGSAEDLYRSVHGRLYNLPEETRVFVGHDYQPGGRELAFETTIGVSKSSNKQLTADTDLETFVAFRAARDATLSPPTLLLQSIQVNINAGHLPEPEDNGQRYLKLPIGLLG
ncbi:MAG: glyoxylase-like metal-dependent hydrolase (beta-lactamase superfamily II) [Myxococcota bacterium]|jgi:glyoxylase-like metal-dependent hydrolase (beta-lactamase superfamily II)